MQAIQLGKRFNMVTVICKDNSYKHGAGKEARYICRCDCGNVFTAKKSAIVHERVYSCGCKRRLKYDLCGKRFGKLLVIETSGKDKRGEILWKCKCDCGNETIVLSSNLRTGHTTSCGCLRGVKPNAKHLDRKHRRLYEIWANMKTRCNNPNYRIYHAYGGKGIEVCPEWNDFEQFLNWAVENGYSKNLTLDRKDNSKNYTPENCRWADMLTQQNNRTNNRMMTIAGATDTMANMARKYNVPSPTGESSTG